MKPQALPFFSAYHVRINTDFFNTISRIAVTQPPARLPTGCALDPCGLAYSLLRPPASTPKVVLARGWTTGLTARVSGPARRDEMGRAGRPGPAGEGLARDETGIRAPQPGASP